MRVRYVTLYYLKIAFHTVLLELSHCIELPGLHDCKKAHANAGYREVGVVKHVLPILTLQHTHSFRLTG